MTTPARPRPDVDATCSLCGAGLGVGAERCGSCGYIQPEFAAQHLLSRRSLWVLAGFLAAVYAVALVIVALAR